MSTPLIEAESHLTVHEQSGGIEGHVGRPVCLTGSVASRGKSDAVGELCRMGNWALSQLIDVGCDRGSRGCRSSLATAATQDRESAAAPWRQLRHGIARASRLIVDRCDRGSRDRRSWLATAATRVEDRLPKNYDRALSDRPCVSFSARSEKAARRRSGSPGGHPPGPPQIRACATRAPGSSRRDVRYAGATRRGSGKG